MINPHPYGTRIVRLSNPIDPSRPFARVNNSAPTIRWTSCYSTGGGYGGGRNTGGGIISTPRYVFRFDERYTLEQMLLMQKNVDDLNKLAAYLIGTGGAITVAGLLAVMAAGIVPGVLFLTGGVLFLAIGMITLSYAQFVQFVTGDYVFYVEFSKPCK